MEQQINNKKKKEANLSADLEQVWQEESPTTAAHTRFADEVDGELGTRRQGGES